MGDNVISELVNKNVVMIPFTVDPHGRRGPLAESFLFGLAPRKELKLMRERPNARMMHRMATQHPCPTNVVTLAGDARWKATSSKWHFFGRSHTASGPKEYFLQKLGLSITKAYALHLCNASLKLGKRPPNARRVEKTTTSLSS